MDLAMAILCRRVHLGDSQVDAAKQLGVSPITLGRWELEKSKPAPSSWAKLSLYLGIGLDGLIRHINRGDPLPYVET